MTYGTVSADAIKSSNGSTMSPASSMGFKNRIINGGMVIDQRNSGASVTANNAYTLDRWITYTSASSKYTVQQNAGSVTPPVGFTNYLGCTSSSSYSLSAGDYFFLGQLIEGFNTADLGWGTANAKTVTLSFWVSSSLTGTFGGTFQSASSTRSYPYTYTISSANTWEYKTVTIAGDTTGTWNKTNGVGIGVYFAIGVGSTYSGTAGSWSGGNYFSATGATSVVGTNGATFYITGVQLEAGSTATSFDYRPYGTELALCQRYFYSWSGYLDYSASGTNGYVVPASTNMRTTPTLTRTASGIFYQGTSGSGNTTLPWQNGGWYINWAGAGTGTITAFTLSAEL